MINIHTKDFGKTKEGHTVTSFELENKNGAAVRILDFGCTVQSFTVSDSKGVPTDVVLGYDDVGSY